MLNNKLIKNISKKIGEDFFIGSENQYFFKNLVFRNENNSGKFITKYIYLYLLDQSIDQIISIIISQKEIKNIVTASNIPQFSSYFEAIKIIDLLIILKNENEYLNYTELGKYLLKTNKKQAAYTKYGENHAKLCNELQLSYIENRKIIVSPLAYYLFRLNKDRKKILLIKLSLKIPIIQVILIKGSKGEVSILKELNNSLSESTSKRRFSNIIFILRELRNQITPKYEYIFDNIKEI